MLRFSVLFERENEGWRDDELGLSVRIIEQIRIDDSVLDD